MRFAYIDSNGNEVPIPSVDALALRIELGAINEGTDLYDAQADQWGPAHTHEIFHTLQRAAEDDDQGFVAPPPPVPATPDAKPEPEPAPPKPPAAAAPEPPPPAPPPPSKEPAGLESLTLAAPAPSDEPEPDTASEAEPGGFDLDLAPPPEESDDPVEGAFASVDDDDSSFDFGDLSGGLEMEADLSDDGPMDFSATSGPDGFGDGLEQESQFDAGMLAPDGGADGGLDLERPMSEFSAESPPAWMEPQEEAEDVMDFSSMVANDDPVEIEGEPRARRKPKDRPSRPKFKRQRSLVGPIVGVVLLAAVGVGAYVAWPIVSGALGGGDEPVEPRISLPAVPDALMPTYRAATDAAFVSVVAEGRAVADVAVDRPTDWLEGVYLANASSYDAIETFWLGVRDEIDAVRDVDDETFFAAFDASLTDAGVSDADRQALTARAEAGYEVAERNRRETYGLVDDLVDAALDLHAFLVANENGIDYTPASTVTSDPVLEARPATPEIREAMQVRVARALDTLDNLDYLDLVTADGLWAAVLRRVQEVGIR